MEPMERQPRPRRDRTPSAPIVLSRLAQADSELEVPIDVEVVKAPPTDAPVDFRERLALALGTTDARLLDAAERGYRGTFASVHDYVRERLALTTGPNFGDALASRDPDELLRRYSGDERLVWSIAVSDEQVMVFELPRESSRAAAIAARLDPDDPDLLT
ncbi:hypothetical protein [Nannocystis radixulma]|uniref:Uncharacterized protein n=1 Tax=Nannocystis radixulma TaxID=2995305 RepID=A0ABT5BAW5_9BACT|nr:hypothetical protein [Nannocystis radixulma]MDC0670878.1 hypothetical protein [Nannocystis radixulma]